jgi:hypothetical protein
MVTHLDHDVESVIAAIKSGSIGKTPIPPTRDGSKTHSGISTPDFKDLFDPPVDQAKLDRYRQEGRAHTESLEAAVARERREAANTAADRQAALLRRRGITEGEVVILDTPILIWSEPNYRIDVHSAPRNSTAKFDFSHAVDASQNSPPEPPDLISFYYLWNNSGDGPVLVFAHGRILANGSITASVEGEVLPQRRQSSVHLSVNIRPILMWDPTLQLSPHPQQSQQLNTSVSADASWWSGDSHHATVLEMVGVSYPGIDVPSGSSILIQMMFSCGWSVTGGKGSTDTDFASGGFNVASLGVEIQRIA